jgi:hypothetical protein
MTVGKEKSVVLPVAISSGSGTGTLTNSWDIVRWLRIKPIAEEDTYNITISDGDGMIMLSRTGQTGTFSEKIEMSLGIMSTIAIDSASQDGTYLVKLDLH